jgi:hypothetical protein
MGSNAPNRKKNTTNIAEVQPPTKPLSVSLVVAEEALLAKVFQICAAEVQQHKPYSSDEWFLDSGASAHVIRN